MTLNMNMREVRLASTGKHLFDAPYAYRKRFEIDGITVEYVNHAYIASDDMTEEQRQKLISEIESTNAEQERQWDINQPASPPPRIP